MILTQDIPGALETGSRWKDPEDGAVQGLELSLQPGTGRDCLGPSAGTQVLQTGSDWGRACSSAPFPRHMESALSSLQLPGQNSCVCPALLWAQPAAAQSLRLGTRRKGVSDESAMS